LVKSGQLKALITLKEKIESGNDDLETLISIELNQEQGQLVEDFNVG
jgi:hypothetical protein